jgi:hypothetical protein
VTTTVEADADPIVFLDGEWLIASFTEQRRVAWRRLADSPVYIGVDDGELVVLAVHNPEANADGSRESAWLDAIESTSGAGARREAPVEA